MDFNAIVKKLRDIEPTNIADPNADAPKADTKAPVVLSEAAQLRIKAGISTVLAESKKVEEAVDMCPEACCGKPVTECKCGPDCEHCDCHSKNAAMKEGKMPQAALDALAKKKGKKAKKTGDDQKDESTETKSKSKKFDEEVEDILKTAEAKLVKEAKKKMVKVDGKMVPDYAADGKGKDDLTKKGGAKKADAKKDAPASKGLSDKQKNLPAGLQKAIAKKKGAKTESTKTTKKAVAESMSFLDAIKIVKESNGEMKVYAVDNAIWNWAKRVAASKVTEGGVKQEAYAAKVYESRGGVWDVSKTIISE
jgi:hypothetical protein